MNITTFIGEKVMVTGVVGKKADTLNVLYDPTGDNKPWIFITKSNCKLWTC